MQPKTTLLFLFFLLPLAGNAQQILPPEVRPARPVEEPATSARKETTEERQPTPPITPVAPPEAKEDPAPEPTEKPPAPEKKPEPGETKPGTKDNRETDTAVPGLNAASLLPIGVPSFDVRMPEFDEDLLISRMKVRELTRIDEDQLDLRDMDLERYLPDGSIDYIISIGRGFYAMSTGRLISSAPTRLRGKAMDLHGEGCVYSRDNDVVKILGKVVSYIYLEEGQLDKPEPKEPPAEITLPLPRAPVPRPPPSPGP
jgi:hypothetical protein